MARLRFSPGTRYLLEGQVYVVRQPLADGRLMVENQSFGGQAQVTPSELYDAWAEGKLQFEVPGNGTHKNGNGLTAASIATEYTIVDFQSLPEKVRDEAWRRYQLLLPLLGLPPKQRNRQAITKYAEQVYQKLQESLDVPNRIEAEKRRAEGKRASIGQGASRTSIERWLRAFETSGYDIRALVPATLRAGGKETSRLDSQVDKLLDAVIKELSIKPHYRTVGDVADLLANRIADENKFRQHGDKLAVPHRATIYRRIQAAGARALLQRAPSRTEQQAAASVMPGPRPDHILERVEIDHTVLDLFLVDDEDRLPIGRPTLTYAVDSYSGMPFGVYVGFEPPSYYTVMQCLLYGILPKPNVQAEYGTKHGWPVFGLPETLVIDNGKEFIGKDLEDACAQLGINLHRTPVRQPWFKGGIERAFRSLNQSLVHKLPGTTFSSITKRGDYDPMKQSCISLTAFYEVLHIFMLDEYAQKWHGGKNGVPARLWHESEQGGYMPSLPVNVSDLRILLGRTEERTVQRAGIDFEALRYLSPELAGLRTMLKGERTRIKYDPSDIGSIYAYDPTGPGRWLQVPALVQDYAQGLSLWKHRLLRGYLLKKKREVNEYELMEAKAHWQAVVVNEFITTRKAKGRKQAARYLNIGAAGQPGAQLANPAPTAALPQPTVAATLPTSGQTGSPTTPTPKVRRDQRKGRTKPPAQPAPTPIAPEPEDDFLADAEGWGSDYNLPRHGHRRG